MATTALYGIIDGLLDAWPSVVPTNVDVFDGYTTSGNNGNFVMVGVEDPNSPNVGQSAHSQQSWANAAGRGRDEAGEVICAAVGWNGDGDMRAARASVKAITDSIETWLRNADATQPFLGIPGLLWAGYGTEIQLLQDQTTDGGAIATVVFRIAYKARL